ncbi:MAG: glycosyltransferase, partial [Deferribacterales bacterium]|nr:glycosyltransferase [Deferribacterales bacterium]
IKENKKSSVKFVLGIQDLIPLVFKDHYLADKDIRAEYLASLEIFKYADEIISISQSAKDDMVRLLNIPQEKIHVVYLGSTLEYKISHKKNNNGINIKEKFGISKPYLMYTGGDEFRKNMDGLIKAFAQCDKEVLDNYQLVLVCDLWRRHYYEEIIADLNLNEKVILTGYVSDVDLDELYTNARAFIFPSLYEGFGLPILEAMYYNLPVTVSKNSSLPEITGENGVFFDPKKNKSICSAIKAILTDDNCRQKQIQLSKERRELFSWNKCAKETMNVFIKAIKDIHKISDPNKCYKCALLSPLPPEKSGIADYTLERIPYWQDYFDLDIYTKEPKASRKILGENYNLFSYEDFDSIAWGYDFIIYQMGNSTYHNEILEYIKKYPGIVVLHDYNLKGLYRHFYYTSVLDEKAIQEVCAIQYETSILDKTQNLLFKDHDKIEINRIVTANALSVIVHSAYAKENLLKYNVGLPVNVVYMGSPQYEQKCPEQVAEKLRSKYGIKNGDTVFGSFGYIHTTKRHYPLMEAFSEFVSKQENKEKYKLLLVGEVDETEKFDEFYKNLCKQYGVKDNIIISGWTDMDEFSSLMYITDVDFNLRYPSNGETSGSLSRLLMIGKPVVVTDIAAFSELPDEICIKIGYGDDEKDEIKEVFNCWVRDKSSLLKMGERARQFMLDECSLKENAKGYYNALVQADKISQCTCQYKAGDFLYSKIVDIYHKYFNDETCSGLNSKLPSIAEIIFRLQKSVDDNLSEKLQIIFDGRIFSTAMEQKANRSGIFFTAYNILIEFLKKTDLSVSLYCDEEKQISVIQALSVMPSEFAGKLSFWKNNKSADNEVFFSPAFAIPDEIKNNKNIKSFIVLHDIIPWIFPEFYNNVKKEDTWIYPIVKNAGSEYYFAISECTARDFKNAGLPLEKNGYSVISWAASENFYQCTDVEKIKEIKQKYGISTNKKYIFSLCSLEPRKNLLFSIKCFLSFIKENNIKDLIFVLGGSVQNFFNDEFNKFMDEYKEYADYILAPGYIDDEDLAVLYSGSEFFVYPSLYEGFGLPLLEAMQCGVPIITSNVSSIPEVMGDVGILINPKDKSAFKDAMKKIYFDSKFKEEQSVKGLQRAKTFSWQKTAEKMIEDFKKQLKSDN